MCYYCNMQWNILQKEQYEISISLNCIRLVWKLHILWSRICVGTRQPNFTLGVLMYVAKTIDKSISVLSFINMFTTFNVFFSPNYVCTMSNKPFTIHKPKSSGSITFSNRVFPDCLINVPKLNNILLTFRKFENDRSNFLLHIKEYY